MNAKVLRYLLFFKWTTNACTHFLKNICILAIYKTSTDQSGLGNMDGLPGAVRHLQQYLIRHLSQARYNAHKSDAMSRHYWNCVNRDVKSPASNK